MVERSLREIPTEQRYQEFVDSFTAWQEKHIEVNSFGTARETYPVNSTELQVTIGATWRTISYVENKETHILAFSSNSAELRYYVIPHASDKPHRSGRWSMEEQHPNNNNEFVFSGAKHTLAKLQEATKH